MRLIKNSFHLKILIPLTLINLSSVYFFIDPAQRVLMVAYFMAILLNQIFLLIIVADMTGIASNHTLLPTWLMALAKFLILAFGILVAVHYIPEKVHIIIGIYIFQLIILVISTKRIVKKN